MILSTGAILLITWEKAEMDHLSELSFCFLKAQADGNIYSTSLFPNKPVATHLPAEHEVLENGEAFTCFLGIHFIVP